MRKWSPGEVMSARLVEWPVVKPGDEIRCGTCGQRFDQRDLRPPFLRPVEDE
jgi:hypothetical protein